MDFASPSWLWALGAVALPIAIHLLSRGQQTRVRVGSVRLIEAAPGRRGRRPKWSELGLLAVRAALLAAVALALASPRGAADDAAGHSATGWILVAPGALADAGSRARFDELRQVGHDPRQLVAGLAPGEPDSGPVRSEDLWSLLREADTLAPPGAPFYVFAAPQLADLRGVRPALARPVEWVSPPPPPAATETHVARTTPARSSGAPVLPAAGTESEPRVAIDVAATREPEGAYVRAALAALATTGEPVLVVESSGAAPAAIAVAGPADLVFWIQQEPIPPALLEQVRAGAIVVAAITDEDVQCDDELIAETAGVAHRIALRRCPAAATPAPPGAPLWRDGGGRVRLAVESLGGGLVYRYAGRLDAPDSDLVLSPAFPEWLRDVLRVVRAVRGRQRSDSGPAAASESDQPGVPAALSQAAPRQLGAGGEPRSLAAAGQASGGLGARGDHTRWCWLAVALLFATERLWVLRSPR